MPVDRRTRLYKLLAVGNRELHKQRAGWCDDDYRYILQQCGAKLVNGKYSATSMNFTQLDTALARLKQLGFKVKQPANNGSDTWRAPRIKKLNALWCMLADEGHVRNRSSFALETFCRKRVKGFTRMPWATSPQLNQAIEELKKWCDRCNVDLTEWEASGR